MKLYQILMANFVLYFYVLFTDFLRRYVVKCTQKREHRTEHHS